MQFPLRILAFDTSSKTGAIACLEKINPESDLEVLSFWTMSVEMQHSEGLLWAIDQSLKACRWELSSLTQIAVGVGPGSFTGLRIGVLTARTLAQGLGCPILEIDSLRLLAHSVRSGLMVAESNADVVFIVATDAAKGEWFSNVSRNSSWTLDNTKSMNLTPFQLVATVKNTLKVTDRWIVIGQRHVVQANIWSEHLPMNHELKLNAEAASMLTVPTGRGFLCAVKEVLENVKFQKTNPLDVRPNYLRASEAEVKREKDLLIGKLNTSKAVPGVD